MNRRWLQLYHQSPPFVRDIAATMRGVYLRSWRYGAGSEERVEQALERDRWTAEQWSAYQQEQLGQLLEHAAKTVPFYRDQWAERRKAGDQASWSYLENWPTLKKKDLRANQRVFVSDTADLSKFFVEHTSGTTGTPLDLWWSRDTVQGWYALFEARGRRWNNVSRHQHWAILGGQPVVPASRTKPPFWVWNAAMNQLYLAANHISKQNAPAYIDAINRYNITHLVAYTSSVTYLAQVAAELGLKVGSQFKLVITNAEPLFDWQRRTIETGLSCVVRETYGMGEIVAGATADTHNKLRMWPDLGVVEVMDDTEAKVLPVGETGRLICTGLMNKDMPLIRYEVGDRGTLSTAKPAADDPIQLPMIDSIEGRSTDMLITRDGRRVFWVNPIFYELPVSEAQLIQENLDRVRVRVVPGEGFDGSHEQLIKQRLNGRMKDVEVVLERMTQIPRGENGKFRPIVCQLSQEEIDRVSVSRS